MNPTPEICYLCGGELVGELSADHVPMKQLFGKSVRKAHNPNLDTVLVHAQCNAMYQHDEDYFVNSLLPLASDSYAGKSVLRDVSNRREMGNSLGLINKVLGEIDRRPSGIVLPHGKLAKRLERERIGRIAWKIVRGLYFLNTYQFLAESTPHYLELVAPGERPPDYFFALGNQTDLGRYPGVFDYRKVEVPELNRFNLWAFLLWDRIIFIIGFHHPECPCYDCTVHREGLENSE